MVKIVWTEASINDLKEIFEYISEDSVRYANLTVNKIYKKAQIIVVKPYTGRIFPIFKNQLIRQLITANYLIIYRIKNDYQVDILRVYHTARLLKRDKLDLL